MERLKRQRGQNLLAQALDIILIPIRPFISKSAQKAYLGSVLITLTSFFLLGLATIAFWLFYYEYVPQPGVEREVYLQFGHGNPHGTVAFPDALASEQAYDISILLHLPRTDNNLNVGNFMLALSMLPSSISSATAQVLLPSTLLSDNTTLAYSRRPAILTYTSPITTTAYTLTNLPLYVFGVRQESESLEVAMFEGVQFAKGASNIPQSARIEVEADQKMQFYSVSVRIIAKLSGLRWILYNHRILSFLVFTSVFWSSSMLSMGIVWFALSIYMSGDDDAGKINGVEGILKDEASIKDEDVEPDLSDASRTFPTLGRQRPLKYERPSVKAEDDDSPLTTNLLSLQPELGEADDEDEFGDAALSAFRDSGIGTGTENIGEGLARRRKREDK